MYILISDYLTDNLNPGKNKFFIATLFLGFYSNLIHINHFFMTPCTLYESCQACVQFKI